MSCHSGEACLPAGREESAFASIIADASCVSMTSSGALFSATAKADPYYYGLSFRRSLPAGRQGGIHLRFNHCTDAFVVRTVVSVLNIYNKA